MKINNTSLSDGAPVLSSSERIVNPDGAMRLHGFFNSGLEKSIS